MLIAWTTPDGSAIERQSISRDELQQEYPSTSFSGGITDATLAGKRAVLIREVPPPVLEYGDQLVAAPHEKQPDGTWRQVWSVSKPDAARISAMKDELRELARQIAGEKMEPPLTSLETMTYQELYRYDADPAPSPSAYLLMVAVRDGRGLTTQQAVDLVRADRDRWLARAATVQRKLQETLVAINVATTGPELLALQQGLEAI